MIRVVLFSSLFLFCTCNAEQASTQTDQGDQPSQEEHQGHHHPEKEHAHHGTANEYMHQSSVEELIQRFESPERDAYQQPEKVLTFLGDLTGKTIMDIGAGSGYFSVKLAAHGAKVIAADVDDDFQAYLRKRIEENKLTNIEPRKIPFDAPGLAPAEVDMVLIVNTYHHIENRTDYFAKVKDGLKTSGELVIIDFFAFDTPVGPKHHKIPIDQVMDELKKAGWSSFTVEVNLLPYQYIIRAVV